jgi:hypothetical protein
MGLLVELGKVVKRDFISLKILSVAPWMRIAFTMLDVSMYLATNGGKTDWRILLRCVVVCL